PRLNRSQSLDLAFLVAEMYRPGGEAVRPSLRNWARTEGAFALMAEESAVR
ncbi:hypothetical protein GT002_11180, partial [Streptomyces sp. SID4917]